MRDAAKRLMSTDVALLKHDVEAKGVPSRAASQASAFASTATSYAAQYASQHKLKVGTGIALGIAGLAAWKFRHEIEDMLDNILHRDDAENAETTTEKAPRGKA